VSPQLSFEGPVLLDPRLDLRKLRGDQFLQTGPQVMATSRIRIHGNLPDACQWKADPFGAADEPEALEVPL
jgi:hypothetical protein